MGLGFYIKSHTGERVGEFGQIGSYSTVEKIKERFLDLGIKYCSSRIIDLYNRLYRAYVETKFRKITTNNVAQGIVGHLSYNNDRSDNLEQHISGIKRWYEVLLFDGEESPIYDNWDDNIEPLMEIYNELIATQVHQPVPEDYFSRIPPHIDYKKFRKLRIEEANLIQTNLIGLYKFISHDDAVSYGDCCDIVASMDMILSANASDDDYDIERIRGYFQMAIDVQGILVYC